MVTEAGGRRTEAGGDREKTLEKPVADSWLEAGGGGQREEGAGRSQEEGETRRTLECAVAESWLVTKAGEGRRERQEGEEAVRPWSKL